MTTNTDAAAKASATSPEALLKAAVSGGRSTESQTPASVVAETGRRIDPLMMAIAGAGLALGTLIGAGTALFAVPRADGDGVALAAINTNLEATRLENSRIAVASDRLDKAIAALRETTDAARTEAKARNAGLAEKVGKMEETLAAKVAALGDRIDHAEREQGSRVAALTAQIEKRPVPALVPAVVAKAEPAQTGSIPDAKPKQTVVESWAVRDVYDGTAMLEDRRRRLIEVAVGDAIPGIGRVDGVERRGRDWVVVTRQGIVTPQPW